MKNILFTIILCASSLIVICSCNVNDNSNNNDCTNNDKQEDIFKNSDPEFDTKRQVIYFKEEMINDIREEIDIPVNINQPNKLQLGCRLTFFNYGDDIRLFNGFRDDIFAVTLGKINVAYVLEGEEVFNAITIGSIRHNQKYGDWALVSISDGFQTISDIFMTPLAMKAYKDGERENFIFLQFEEKDKYMNVIFHGTPVISMIVSKLSNTIINQDWGQIDDSGLINGPGPFWHKKY